MNNTAAVSQIIKTHKLSELMLRALYTGADGGVVTCNARTERALIARELIHATESTLTSKGVALIAELRTERSTSDSTEQEPRTARTAADLPEGTRVASREGRKGTVNGHDLGRVTNTEHANYGREYVGVTWDPTESNPWGQRSRSFVDELHVVLV
ncbi:hypothetical protein N4G70_28915 [Streptomyces sp. ASQP_92]|uniref:hypothetical protein n=1 Tax=Streptomyces sp. ASQP_92 TaxID=2979116 RepID=UPI0021BF6DB1|nr:hypothetical protein [Streptomyces sp. ASQP_92]MCT9092862.1 hypothetical protein [Streptomyces sp. ASQP_92]